MTRHPLQPLGRRAKLMRNAGIACPLLPMHHPFANSGPSRVAPRCRPLPALVCRDDTIEGKLGDSRRTRPATDAPDAGLRTATRHRPSHGRPLRQVGYGPCRLPAKGRLRGIRIDRANRSRIVPLWAALRLSLMLRYRPYRCFQQRFGPFLPADRVDVQHQRRQGRRALHHRRAPCALTPEPRQRLRQQTLEVDIVLRRAGVQETAFVEQDDLRGLAPLSYAHINPYGRFEVDLDRRIDFKRKAA